MRSRCAMSLAALRVKVSAAMRAGSLRPVRTRWAMRAQITRVFPDPGPAMTRIGPSGAVTASRWRSLSVARSCSWSYRAVDCLERSWACRMGWYGKRRWADDRRPGRTRRGQSRGHVRSSGTLRVAERDAKLRPTRLKAPLTCRSEAAGAWRGRRRRGGVLSEVTREAATGLRPSERAAPALDRRPTAC